MAETADVVVKLDEGWNSNPDGLKTPDGWGYKQVGMSGLKDIVDPIDRAVSPALDATLQYANQVETIAGLVEKGAPLYADAANLVIKTAVDSARSLLQGWQVGIHMTAIDVPFRVFCPDSTKDKGSLARFGALWTEATADKDLAELILPPKDLGKAGLTRLLIDSLYDEGDKMRPLLGPSSTFAGLSLVAGAQGGADFAAILSKIKALWAALVKVAGIYTDAYTFASPEAPPISNLKVTYRPGGLLITFEDSGLTYPYEVKAPAEGQPGYVFNTEPAVEIFVTTKSDLSFTDPPPDGPTTDGAATPADGWRSIYTKDGARGDGVSGTWVWGVGIPEGRKRLFAFTIDEDRLAKLLREGRSDGSAAPGLYVGVRFQYPDVSQVEGTASEQAGPWYTSTQFGSWVPRQIPSGGGVPPNWHGGNAKNQGEWSGSAGSLLNFIDRIDATVLTPLEDLIEDTSGVIASYASATRRAAVQTKASVQAIKDLIQLLKDLSNATAGVYWRVFNYYDYALLTGDTTNLLGSTSDPPPPTGMAALEKEYRESIAALPFDKDSDLLAGIFLLVPLPPTLSQSFQPTVEAWERFLRLLGLTPAVGLPAIDDYDPNIIAQAAWAVNDSSPPPSGPTTSAVQAPDDDDPPSNSPSARRRRSNVFARGLEVPGWETVPDATQPYLGNSATTARPQPTSPVVGSDEAAAVAATRALDLNCPPRRDLTNLQFGPDFKPVSG